jgi:hypothetical protein
MLKSTIRLLIINCTLMLLLVSCASHTLKGFSKTIVEQPIYKAPYFSNTGTDYVYKANISIYGKKLSGLFIAKQINDSCHRIVFTTEFGNSLLDFEIGEHTFKINSIVADLDKKMIIKTLKNDFRLVLANSYHVQAQYENATDKVYKSKDGNRYNLLFIKKQSDNLYKLVRASRYKEKVVVSYSNVNNQLAESLTIEHKNIKLDIVLNYMNN